MSRGFGVRPSHEPNDLVGGRQRESRLGHACEQGNRLAPKFRSSLGPLKQPRQRGVVQGEAFFLRDTRRQGLEHGRRVRVREITCVIASHFAHAVTRVEQLTEGLLSQRAHPPDRRCHGSQSVPREEEIRPKILVT